jgi:multiple sugar transport system substrate-binding protein
MATQTHVTRRTFLAGALAIGGVAALAGCVTGGGGSSSGSGAITLQSSLSDPAPKAALTKLVGE